MEKTLTKPETRAELLARIAKALKDDRARGFHDRDEMQDGGAPYNLEIARLSQMVLPEFDDPKILAWPARWPLWRLQERGIHLPSYTFAQNAWRKAR